MESGQLVASRAEFSVSKLDELARRLDKLPDAARYPNMTIYAVGSYGRQEASKFSDLDLFFLTTSSRANVEDPRSCELRLFGSLIEMADAMGFPKFSNDAEFLVVLDADGLLEKLGSRADDQENYFTARMLLLLEAHCLYGRETFDSITNQVVEAYFRDYHDHPSTFQPTFLLNDICRFWKTMLLNYENRRTPPSGVGAPETIKIRQKVRNFKLKYSRMTTCFASIAVLGSHAPGLRPEDVVRFTKLSPQGRIRAVLERVPEAKSAVAEVQDKYAWFLDMTGLPTQELERHFEDKKKRTEMFQRAAEYGDSMYKLLQVVDDKHNGLLRTLVI